MLANIICSQTALCNKSSGTAVWISSILHHKVEHMEIFGYIASVLIGISLGLIGGGGSILTVPVLVYLFGLDALTATEYSLFIVGISSVAGSFSYFKKGWVDLRTAIVFGLPSVISIFIARNYILPLVPDKILTIGNWSMSKDTFLLLVFAGLMLLASFKMIRKHPGVQEGKTHAGKSDTFLAAMQGSVVGVLTGFVGAGGGFMIIPTLVSLLRTPMKVAIGTSLVIIACNSLVGFFTSMEHMDINWNFLATISAIAVAGIFIGSHISGKIDGNKLKPAFGWFILLMGMYIMVREVLY